MNVYIDESGTHKHPGHATNAIVYIAVNQAESFENKLLSIEKELRISSFHWADERWFMRSKFLDRALALDFTVKVAIFEPPVQQENMIELVFSHIIVEKNIQNIFIDAEKPRWYERKLKKVLRDKGISVRKVRTVRSASSVGIQLADALAGLARYVIDYPGTPDSTTCWQRLKKEGKLIGQFIFEAAAQKTSP